MDDRRHFGRTFLTFFAQVTNRRNGRLLGYLADLTTQGALLVGDIRVREKAILYLSMELPEDFPDRTHLDLDAEVVWRKPDEDPDLVRIGLRLINLDEDTIKALEYLLDHYGLHQQ